ncbi:MAG: hypothetical protein H0W72_06960 [Planctomycetes bacterium]|nr:hypothetical protein [Planctomycetota bacterium]
MSELADCIAAQERADERLQVLLAETKRAMQRAEAQADVLADCLAATVRAMQAADVDAAEARYHHADIVELSERLVKYGRILLQLPLED